MKKTHTSRIDPNENFMKDIADAAARGEPTIMGLPNGWDRLAECLDNCGVKQGEVAKKCLIAPTTLSRWKKGKALPESAVPLILLAKYFNVSLDWLLYLDGTQTTLSPEEQQILEMAEKILYTKGAKKTSKK